MEVGEEEDGVEFDGGDMVSVIAGAGVVTVLVEAVSMVVSLERPQPVSGKVINDAIKASVEAERVNFIIL